MAVFPVAALVGSFIGRGVVSVVAGHLLCVLFEKWLNDLSVVGNEFIDVDLTALVSVDLLELLSHLMLKLGSVHLLGQLRESLVKRNFAVAIGINGSETEFLENLVLLLLGKLTLGDVEVGDLLCEESDRRVSLLLGGLSSCKLCHLAVAEDLN